LDCHHNYDRAMTALSILHTVLTVIFWSCFSQLPKCHKRIHAQHHYVAYPQYI
jgi:hypothetical protein